MDLRISKTPGAAESECTASIVSSSETVASPSVQLLNRQI